MQHRNPITAADLAATCSLELHCTSEPLRPAMSRAIHMANGDYSKRPSEKHFITVPGEAHKLASEIVRELGYSVRHRKGDTYLETGCTVILRSTRGRGIVDDAPGCLNVRTVPRNGVADDGAGWVALDQVARAISAARQAGAEWACRAVTAAERDADKAERAALEERQRQARLEAARSVVARIRDMEPEDAVQLLVAGLADGWGTVGGLDRAFRHACETVPVCTEDSAGGD